MGDLIRAGVDVFRINFSHGSREEHTDTIRRLRALPDFQERPVGILADLCGPKIRIGRIQNNATTLVTQSEVDLEYGDFEGTASHIPCTYEPLARDLSPGSRVLINDGALELQVTGITGSRVSCRVIRGGPLSSRKGMNLPGVSLSTSSVTEKDRLDMLAALAAGVDFVAISFVRSAMDVATVRAWAEEAAPNRVMLIAKIERPEAVANIDTILDAADGIMVARGDLGVEMDLASVPLLQKQLIRRANSRDKIVITATQMLESMTHSASPTRAEVSDVANAILDGTDAIMLSGETAVGQNPVLAVKTMSEIAQVTEKAPMEPTKAGENANPRHPTLDALGHSIMHLATRLQVKAIITLTDSGRTAAFLSKARPPVAVYAFTPNPSVAARLTLYRNVIPICRMDMIKAQPWQTSAYASLTQRGVIATGDQLLIATARMTPSGVPDATIHVTTAP